MAYKRSGRHAGAPTREERRIAYQLALEGPRAILGPPVPPGLRKGPRTQWDHDEWDRLCRDHARAEARERGWGGKRNGSGRPKKEGGALQFVVVKMPREFAGRLESLPEGAKSEYIRKALDLLANLVPPEKFVPTSVTKLAGTSPLSNPGEAGAQP